MLKRSQGLENLIPLDLEIEEPSGQTKKSEKAEGRKEETRRGKHRAQS